MEAQVLVVLCGAERAGESIYAGKPFKDEPGGLKLTHSGAGGVVYVILY